MEDSSSNAATCGVVLRIAIACAAFAKGLSVLIEEEELHVDSFDGSVSHQCEPPGLRDSIADGWEFVHSSAMHAAV
ncbi:MAG: hypothetical protein ACK5ZC_14030 [Pirellulaceae bacterium]|jgi:hypothetical protein